LEKRLLYSPWKRLYQIEFLGHRKILGKKVELGLKTNSCNSWESRLKWLSFHLVNQRATLFPELVVFLSNWVNKLLCFYLVLFLLRLIILCLDYFISIPFILVAWLICFTHQVLYLYDFLDDFTTYIHVYIVIGTSPTKI
jgi:hypothetical protein